MSSRRTLLLALVLVLVLTAATVIGGLAARRWAARRSAPNILLISIDTLRPDHLSLYGYSRGTSPRIDAFFAKADIYERAYSAEANTAPSVVSFLTGLYPSKHGVRLLYQRIEEDVPILADYLSARGYQAAAIVSNVVLTSEALGLDRRFEYYDDFVDERVRTPGVFERRASRTTDAAIAWLHRHRDPGRPHFLWVHYIDPHGPYAPPPDRPTDFTHEGRVDVDPERIPKHQRMPELRDDGLEYVDRYDEEIAYLDREVGRLLASYEDLGLASDGIVVLTADHGETMIEQDRHFAHGYHVWESIMRVPLAVRRPGVEGRRVRAPVSLVDLVPSLLDYAGIDPPPDLDGVVLDERPADAPVSLEATRDRQGQMRAAVIGTEKWVARVDRQGRIVERWQADLERDGDAQTQRDWEPGAPGEAALTEWIEGDPDPGGVPKELQAGRRRFAPKVAPGRSKRQLEALRALGYVE